MKNQLSESTQKREGRSKPVMGISIPIPTPEWDYIPIPIPTPWSGNGNGNEAGVGFYSHSHSRFHLNLAVFNPKLLVFRSQSQNFFSLGLVIFIFGFL
jgi:hypothetical protein